MPRELYNQISSLEPLFPMDRTGALREMAADLLYKSAQLGASLHPTTRQAVVEQVRQMNSYYSNLIEGNNTHPRDIEKALHNDFSPDPEKRALQLESKAHIEVQKLIEARLASEPELDVCEMDFICWIHKEFFSRLPDEFRKVKTKSGGEDRVLPGELRVCEVEVGRHVPPAHLSLGKFMQRFAVGYKLSKLEPLQRIIAAAASHHRLTWIHPFLDGNGRVSRLFTHAYLTRAKTEGHGLWMVSRGFARKRDAYMAALGQADLPRQGDLDGRGNLSDKGLSAFCSFFLRTAVDQVEFMQQLLELDAMQDRLFRVAEKWSMSAKVAVGNLPHLLRDVFVRGEVTRGEAARSLQMPERTSRRFVKQLLDDHLLLSDGPGAPLKMNFPIAFVEYYFPRLYPAGVETA